MNAYPSETHQGRFLKKLGQRFDKRGDMVNAIGQVLHLGKDAVYRRLRGDTALTADELISLAQEFSIHLDGLKEHNSLGTQQLIYPNGLEEITHEAAYYEQLEAYCVQMANLPEVEVDYATPELPLYYEFFTPTLLAFKTYVYGLTTWNFAKWKDTPFNPLMIDPKVAEIGERIMPLLFEIPGRELWSIGILDITLRQIEHAVEVGRLNDPELVSKMFKEVEATIQHMENMTVVGKKFMPGEVSTEKSPDFRVYHNELTNTNNVVIVKSSAQSFVFSTFVNPNLLISMDERIQLQMETWFDNLVDSSNSLSHESSKYYRQFFASLRRKAKATIGRVNGLLN